MRYVIIRDDDTNAFTPVECLERLYRPFLDRGLPVNLAVIPDVATAATTREGAPEGFLLAKNGHAGPTQPIGVNKTLTGYLLANPGYHIVQHGCHHEYLEFDRSQPDEISRRLDHGADLLMQAGFPRPQTFVAPYDKLSRPSLRAVAARFRVLSTGWFELRRFPRAWWPKYAWKKFRHHAHWQIGRTVLLSHPGCILSCQHRQDAMIEALLLNLHHRRLTVLVTHWWEYFRDQSPDRPFIDFLHRTADYLAADPDLQVITFADIARRGLPAK